MKSFVLTVLIEIPNKTILSKSLQKVHIPNVL